MAKNIAAPVLTSVTFIGLGEAGILLADGFVKAGIQVSAYDIKVHDAELRAAVAQRAQAHGVTLHDELNAALEGADLVISAVTATSAAQAAVSAARYLRSGQYFLDINSVSPTTKRMDRDAIEGAGASYIESAVMAPVPPYGIRVPMLLGGIHAEPLSESLNKLGLKTRAVGIDVGIASAIKMCRSVMIKGLEALTVECMTAARSYGVENAVLESLAETFPSMGWTDALPNYLISRVAEHGRRRAAEMREVMETLADAGIDPLMAQATAKRQDDFVDAMERSSRRYPVDADFIWQDFMDQGTLR